MLFSVSCTTPDDSETNGDETPPETTDLFALTVLHSNDCHARIKDFNEWGNTCDEEDDAAGECFGGVARRATAINRIRGENENVLLLDAGDQFQGTLFYTLYKGLAAQHAMNLLGYDAMTLGNHEFDDGPDILAEFVAGLDFPVVSSNIDCSNEPLLADLVAPYEILEIGGREIGIVGFTTEAVPSLAHPGPNLIFNNIEESVKIAVDELKGLGVNIIIALSHSGVGRDIAVAAGTDGIDIIVGGHTHTLLSNTHPDAEGAYPIEVESPSGDPVLVVQAKSWGMYLGDLDVKFNDSGVAVEWEGEPVLLDASIEKDESVLDEVEILNEEVEPLTWLVVGESEVDLEGREEIGRHYESNLGNLICDSLLWETVNADTQIAFFNGGGIRSGIRAGEITYANILEVLPFGDTLAYFELVGSDIHELLEYSLSRAEDPLNEGTGRFLQTAGLRYEWDPDAEVGERITKIEVENADGFFVPLDDGEIYKIVTLLYIREGGDGYEILEHRAIDPYDFGRVISDILVDYLAEYSPISPGIEGRITRVE